MCFSIKILIKTNTTSMCSFLSLDIIPVYFNFINLIHFFLLKVIYNTLLPHLYLNLNS